MRGNVASDDSERIGWRLLTSCATLVIGLLVAGHAALGEQRFPPPEFETGHQLPVTQHPLPRSLGLEYLDVAVLAGALGLATWLVHAKRSRKGVLAVSLFSLAYFGFYREGCICAIGSVQNVALGLFNRGYAVPLTVLAFFALPLVFSLFAGRTFCAAVCPHGALQDWVLLKPVKVPLWLERGLGLIPFVYLGAAVVLAATGSAFVICSYDPFVPLFRLSGGTFMLLLGAAFLAAGVFVGRPYCRFLCPYGALLKLGAMTSRWRVRVTPDYCTQCRLCEQSCPLGAMREPVGTVLNPATLAADRKRLSWLLALLPALVLAGTWIGGKLSVPASQLHPTVKLAERYVRELKKPEYHGAQTAEALSLARAGQNAGEILATAIDVRRRLATAGTWFGGWVGLVIGAGLIGLSIRRTRSDYEPDRGACFACARCFEYCPNERARRGIIPILSPAAAPSPAAAANES